MADRRYKLLKDGLPGPSNFERRALVADDMVQWNATLKSWEIINRSALGGGSSSFGTPRIGGLDSTTSSTVGLPSIGGLTSTDSV